MSPPAPPSPLTAHLGYWLRLVSNTVSHAFAGRLAALDVGVAEWVLMRHLFDGGPTSPGDLAAAMGMTRGAISKLEDRLIDRGLLARVPDAIDRRRHRLLLTEEGRTLVPRLAALADDNDAAFFGALDPGVRATFGEALRMVAAAHGLHHPPLT